MDLFNNNHDNIFLFFIFTSIIVLVVKFIKRMQLLFLTYFFLDCERLMNLSIWKLSVVAVCEGW